MRPYLAKFLPKLPYAHADYEQGFFDLDRAVAAPEDVVEQETEPMQRLREEQHGHEHCHDEEPSRCEPDLRVPRAEKRPLQQPEEHEETWSHRGPLRDRYRVLVKERPVTARPARVPACRSFPRPWVLSQLRARENKTPGISGTSGAAGSRYVVRRRARWVRRRIRAL